MRMAPELSTLRADIDDCDAQIRQLIRRRVTLVRKIVAVKVESGTTMHDPDRDAVILAHTRTIECEIEKNLLRDVYSLIFQSGKRLWSAVK